MFSWQNFNKCYENFRISELCQHVSKNMCIICITHALFLLFRMCICARVAWLWLASSRNYDNSLIVHLRTIRANVSQLATSHLTRVWSQSAKVRLNCRLSCVLLAIFMHRANNCLVSCVVYLQTQHLNGVYYVILCTSFKMCVTLLSSSS